MMNNELLKKIYLLIDFVQRKYNIEILNANFYEKDDKFIIECKIKRSKQQKIAIQEDDVIFKNNYLYIYIKK